MAWYFYGTILACSFINWGGLATNYNIRNNKGSFYFLRSLNFNDEILYQQFPNEMDVTAHSEIIQKQQNKPFLSKIIYYQTIK